MLVLVTGGSGSGKSAFAENLIMQLAQTNKGNHLYYIATMKVYGEEGLKKVERHRNLRAGKGFITIEKTDNINQCISDMESNGICLLECMSNLVANEMFADEKIVEETLVVSKVTEQIYELMDSAKDMVIVTNNVFDDGIKYDETTLSYIRALGKINQLIAKKVNKVIEVVAGIPVTIKDN